MRRIKAQASIEFTIAFVSTIIFLILACNLFVWFNHNLVRRQVAYENTRVKAGRGRPASVWYLPGEPGKADFFTPPPLDIFSPGGRK